MKHNRLLSFLMLFLLLANVFVGMSFTASASGGSIGSNIRSDGEYLYMTMEDGLLPTNTGTEYNLNIDSNSTIEGKYCVNISQDGTLNAFVFQHLFDNMLRTTEWSIKINIKDTTDTAIAVYPVKSNGASILIVTFIKATGKILGGSTEFTSFTPWRENTIYKIKYHNIDFSTHTCSITISNATESQTLSGLSLSSSANNFAGFRVTGNNALIINNILIDDWTVGTQAQIQSNNPTNIEETSATANGLIVNDGSPLQNGTQTNLTAKVYYDDESHLIEHIFHYNSYYRATIVFPSQAVDGNLETMAATYLTNKYIYMNTTNMTGTETGNITRVYVCPFIGANPIANPYITIQPYFNDTKVMGKLHKIFKQDGELWGGYGGSWYNLSIDITDQLATWTWSNISHLQMNITLYLANSSWGTFLLDTYLVIEIEQNYSYNQTVSGNFTGENTGGIPGGLTPGQLYFYRAYGQTNYTNASSYSWGDEKYFLTKPEAPTNSNYNINTGTMKINLSWTKGTGANQTVILMKQTGMPTSVTDGTIIYNGTGTYTLYSFVAGSAYYFKAYSYKNYSSPKLFWFSDNSSEFEVGGLLINCFDENTHANLTFNVKVSNPSGSQVYENTSCTNTLVINASLCPQGTGIQIIVSATGYQQRIYTLNIHPNIFYLLNAYLPPVTAPGNGTENCELRPYIDSKTITSYTVNAVIPLTYALEDMIGVELYNDSLYGTYGGWLFVASNKYSFTTTQVTVNKTVLDKNTTMVRVNYYYNFCTGGVESVLYNLRVINEANTPIENAFMQVKRYINSTGAFVDVSSIFTDSNGIVNIYLVPNAHYKVFISKSGYTSAIGDYIPAPPNAYGQTEGKSFMLYKSTTPDMWDYVTYVIGPEIFDHNTSFDVYFDISCPSGILEWFKLTITQYNSTTNTWVTIWSFNETTLPTGGNLSYNINANGTYGIQCSFKLVGYDYYTFGVPGSSNKLIYTLGMYADAIRNIDDTITKLVGRSPVFVGNVVVGYTALIVTSLLTLILFTFSPKFSGLGLIAVGMVTAWMKGPLNVISNATVGWNVVVIIIILGILVIAWTNMRETGGQT